MRWRWRAAPLLVLAALAGPLLSGPVFPAVPSEADRLWLLGSGAFADGLHDVAYRELGRFAAVAPADPRQGEASLLRGKAAFAMARASETLGRAAEAQGRYGEALAAFELAEQQPLPAGTPGEALFWQGEALLRLRRFEEAQDRYGRFLALKPRSPYVPEALYARGMAELELGRPEAAMPPLLELLRDHPTHERAATAGYSAARELIRVKRWDEALAILAGYASRYPASPYLAETRYLLGVAQLETKRPEGVRTLEQFIAQSPAHELAPTARALVAEAHIAAGRLREALEQYQAMVRAAPTHALAPRALYRVGELALRLGRAADAEAAWTALRREFPQDERVGAAGLATAELLVQRKQWDQALEVAQAVAERRGPERIPALLVLGQSALQLRRNVQAVQAYHSVTLEAPGDSPERFQGLAGLALASEVVQDMASARRAYQEILQQSRDEKLLRWAQERLEGLEPREAPTPREPPRPRGKPKPGARPGSRS
jgi:TolA-binding protein